MAFKYNPITNSFNYYHATFISILSKSSSVNQNVGGNAGTTVWWTWDGQVRNDSVFTHSTSLLSSRIAVGVDGWYKIKFIGNVQQTGIGNTTLYGVYRINGGKVIKSGTKRGYSSGSASGNISTGLEDIVQLSAGGYVEVGTIVEQADGAYTLNTSDGTAISDDQNRFIIELIS